MIAARASEAAEGGRRPLIEDDEAEQPKAKSPSQHPRLFAMDVLRGLTCALMIFVDDVGAAYPVLNHASWSGLTLADFVMPTFLFMVGVSSVYSLRRYKDGSREMRCKGTWQVVVRAFKLFCLGLLLQGGGWIGGGSYGFNLATMRLCGILQRIAFAFVVVALMELWLPEGRQGEVETLQFPVLWKLFGSQVWRWLVVFLCVALQLALTFGLYVPSWSSRYGLNAHGNQGLLQTPFEIQCNVRGAYLTPECSAAGYIDRLILGQDRLGVWMSDRMPQCSPCSPGAPNPTFRPHCHHTGNEPLWCNAHIYDPEGILATVPTVATVWLGVHFAQAIGVMSGKALLAYWSGVSFLLLASGVLLNHFWVPFNKQLWSLPYLLVTAGSAGAALALLHLLLGGFQQSREVQEQSVMAKVSRRVLSPMEMMGMNAIFIFFWHGTAEAIIAAFWWHTPKYDDQHPAHTSFNEWIRDDVIGWALACDSDNYKCQPQVQLIWVLFKIVCFTVATWICYRKGIFWKV